MTRFSISVLSLLLFSGSAFAQQPQLGKDPIDMVIAAMTDAEKANLLMGTGIPEFKELKTPPGSVPPSVPGAAGNTFAILRLGIPSIVFPDGPAGVRISPTRQNDTQTYYATAFPVATLLASTWNPELVQTVGKAMGNEVREYGADVLLGPALNIHRNPLCGRNFEYYSEDPVISGKIAAAMVNGVQSNGVGTSIKHFAANNQETNRLSINEHITERAMREIYLRGFEIAVKESQPWTVMSSYNLVEGTHTSARKDLLTDILRDEWGFKRLVMSDWFGGYMGWKAVMAPHGNSDVVAQLKAGNDLLMPGTGNQYDALLSAIKSGKIAKTDVDKNVKRVLELILKSPGFTHYKFSNKPDLKSHAAVTREAASEGMVLLKNESALPMNPSKVALFGVTSYNFISGGTGSGDVHEAYSVSLLDGLKNAGYQIDGGLAASYHPAVSNFQADEKIRREKEGVLFHATRQPEYELSEATIAKAAKENALAIITIGRNAGEDGDRKVADDFNLAADEVRLLDLVTSAFKKEN